MCTPPSPPPLPFLLLPAPRFADVTQNWDSMRHGSEGQKVKHRNGEMKEIPKDKYLIPRTAVIFTWACVDLGLQAYKRYGIHYIHYIHYVIQPNTTFVLCNCTVFPSHFWILFPHSVDCFAESLLRIATPIVAK